MYKKVFFEACYLSSEQIINFLSEFGGLIVEHPHHLINNQTDRFHLDPLKAIADVYKEQVIIYEQRVGEILVAIGEAYNEHMVILMTTKGRIYVASDDILILIGQNPCDALETLCEGKETTNIPLIL